MAGTFANSGAISDRTQEGRGKGPAGSWAGGEGGLSTGIGVGALASGVPQGNFGPNSVADLLPTRIGGGVRSTAGSSNSDSNLGNMVVGFTLTGGTGYTNGVYLVQSAGGGQPAGAAEVQLTVAGGIITAAECTNSGSAFASAPTFSLAALGGGTGGVLTALIGREGDLDALGTGFGVNKGTRYLIAVGTVANNAAISGGYLNRSGRTMVAGEGAWAVQP